MRACIAGEFEESDLTAYLRARLFTLPKSGWRAFAFVSRDWEIAASLSVQDKPALDRRLLEMVLAYIESNLAAVANLYAMSDVVSGRLLKLQAVELAPGADRFSSTESQSLFAFRILCATHATSPTRMKQELEAKLARSGWCHSRLMYPLINLISNQRSPDDLDDFLAYFAVGDELPEETLALKLLLSDTAARDAKLAFKLFIGLMGHPYDACELLLDHAEFVALGGSALPEPLQESLCLLSTLLPGTRAERIYRSLRSFPAFRKDAPPEAELQETISAYGCGIAEIDILSRFVALEPFVHQHVAETDRPLLILANMRSSEYPVPEQFSQIVATRSSWSFVDGGRIIGALLRSIYMVDRTAYDLEARDVARLLSFYGAINPMLVSGPSAMPFLRRLAKRIGDGADSREVERASDASISAGSPLAQRLWINELQWRLRRLEDEGRIKAWLALIRSDAKVRPLYLTGINWPWVESIIAEQRLKPFRSFDGAYLLLLMEMEANTDPLRLKLVLDGLLAGKDFEGVVATILDEFGDKAPAFLRRYLTSTTLLANGLAANHFAALDLRLKAIEEGVRKLGFGPLLTKENWLEETKLLTTELLLLNVNAGKFEVPWATFRRDELDRNKDLHVALQNINAGAASEMLSSLVETPKVYKNGRKVQYKYRRGSALLFQLVVQVVEDFLDHPAFGLEIILSGRFRHNNVLQELQAALASVESMDIHPVTQSNRRMLAAAYRPALERFLYDWCTRRMHSLSEEKPDALFDIIPSPDAMTELIAACLVPDTFEGAVDVITDWLKDRLRVQVAAAGIAFVQDLRTGLTAAFGEVELKQIEVATNIYRPDDVRRIHNAVLEAVLRRVDDLASWFDGVDTTTAARVSLVQLGHAAERLFDNVLPGKWLTTEPDLASAGVSFEPVNVKVAFDLVRELAFNAVKGGPAGEIRLSMREVPGTDPVAFEFENEVEDQSGAMGHGVVHGHRYDNPFDALVGDKNSGRLKIAASAATLIGEDTEITWRSASGRYSVVVPLHRKEAL